MFASERPSLQSLNVKGDLIVKPETSNGAWSCNCQCACPQLHVVIMTRSKAKQGTSPDSSPNDAVELTDVPVPVPHEYSVIPFPVKALKLLLHDLHSGGDAAAISAAGATDLVDSDDDEDWADEDKVGEEAWLSGACMCDSTVAMSDARGRPTRTWCEGLRGRRCRGRRRRRFPRRPHLDH